MATLVSPGVSVSIIDESFYSTSGPGTVPLVFIATEQDKLDSSGEAIAEGTLKENAGKLLLVTSQRELGQIFGTPKFHEINGTARHGYELNEYGLLALHSYLGIANRAYVVRADIDLAELEPLDVEPIGLPKNGTYWLDLNNTVYGIFAYNATSSRWDEIAYRVIDNVADVDSLSGAPLLSYPAEIGDIVVVAGKVTANNYENRIYRRTATAWELLDNAAITEDIQFKSHIQYPTTRSDSSPLVAGDFWIKTTTPNGGSYYSVKLFNAETAQWKEIVPTFYTSDNLANDGLGAKLVAGSLYVQYNGGTAAVAQTLIKRHNGKAVTEAVGNIVSPTVTAGTLVINGTTVTISAGNVDSVITEIINAGITDISAKKDLQNKIVIFNQAGKTITLGNTAQVAELGLTHSVAYSNWEALNYTASYTEPYELPATGRLWYSNEFKVDLLENDGAGAWTELTADVYVVPSEPLAAVNGDLWVDTDDIENYPRIYRKVAGDWELIDNADQTTPFGIIFADARTEPLAALDADRPDPLLYPKGMLLWNTRYSTLNVKRWVKDYTFEGVLIGDRWVNESGNDFDGSPLMGRHAVKKVITQAIAATIVDNEDIRSEAVFYNLICAPGYTEVIDEMISLNVDRKETAFVIGDSPFRLKATGTELQRWPTNYYNAASNGDKGLLTADKYLGVYYPSGLSTNLDGSEVVVPPSHMVLRTYAYNDQVAYQWFAPAGYNRGMVTNAVSVGYVNEEDEYVPVQLNEGLRDVLYTNNINPIALIPNRGLVVFGQKTRSPVASALDRINVARLTNYIRYQADLLARPFLFEPNDELTRKNVKNAFDRFLAELVTLRGLYDFRVICDESNNTPARIDRNELWVDIAIQPTKAVEFIYIPIRVVNTGAF